RVTWIPEMNEQKTLSKVKCIEGLPDIVPFSAFRNINLCFLVDLTQRLFISLSMDGSGDEEKYKEKVFHETFHICSELGNYCSSVKIEIKDKKKTGP
ncbi:MAG: hypothetical protein O2984_07860, partial [Bacteroidetes bacterium]|nr:hypothetical protein [Bacteroidota bacterium]